MAYKTSAYKKGVTHDQLVKEYRRLAKVADQRLVRLEGYRHQKGFKNVDQWAYKRAQKRIQSWGGKKRFNTKPPANDKQLRAKINDILEFLNAPTSTKKGVIQMYKKKADKFNQLNGTFFSWQEFKQFITSDQTAKMINQYGSDTFFKTVGKIYRKGVDLAKNIEEYNNTHKQLNPIQKQIADELIEFWTHGS